MYVCFSSVIELLKRMGICCCMPICLGERFINITSIKTIYLTLYFFPPKKFKIPKTEKKLKTRKTKNHKPERQKQTPAKLYIIMKNYK